MTWLVIAVGAVAAGAVVFWFMSARKYPENAASHNNEPMGLDTAGRGTGRAGVADRPAGPDAENMASDTAGGFTAPGVVPSTSNGDAEPA